MNAVPEPLPLPAARLDAAAPPHAGHDVAVPLKVAILYDGVPAGRRAMGLVRRMLEQAGGPIHLFPAVWRFDLFEQAKARAHAAAEAGAADLLIVATARPDALPAAVERWISDFIAWRRGTPVTILAMWGLDDEWTISLYERNQNGRIQPTSSATSSPAAARTAGFTARCFDPVVAAA